MPASRRVNTDQRDPMAGFDQSVNNRGCRDTGNLMLC